jgi:hypothetical protein
VSTAAVLPFVADLERLAAEFEAFGAGETAAALRESARRAGEGMAVWWNTPLSIAEAAAWGGYSESQLRKLVSETTIAVAPDGRVRRRDVPVRPGHVLPLGLEPAPSGRADWVGAVVERRQLKRVG